ncbi:hypothetical protein TI05_06030 [Achromatium sp. WMS3]|nr:hypothetical protein TI05_06030 [Achromatium sp. WMS3]
MFGMLNAATNVQAISTWSNRRASNTNIQFDPQLIATLKAEHQEILSACERLEIVCDKDCVPQTAEQLQALEEQMRQHRIQEDVKLIIFIEKRYSDNNEMAALLSMFRKERDRFKRQLSEFFAKYALLRECPALITDLRNDLSYAIKLVVGMLEAEEQNFFPLYSTNIKFDVSNQITVS